MNGFHRGSPKPLNKLELKMSKKRKSFVVERLELPNQQDENEENTKIEISTKQQKEDVRQIEKCPHKKSQEKCGNIVDKAPTKKPKTEHKPRQSFEDAIRMIYDYRFYRRKKRQRSNFRLSTTPSEQENQSIKVGLIE